MSKYVGRIITDQAPAGYSVFFNGTNGFLNLAVQSFTGDFTVEAWIYPTRLSDSGGSGQIFSYDVINIQFATDSAGNLIYYNNSISTSATAAISLNSWQHVALCRSGTTTRIFVNGTLRATNASDSGTRAFSAIGQFASGGAYLFQGYISNVRWAATALYTANFTPPTQLLRIANTNLLTCNSPAIVDQSSNAFAITTNGNAAVSTFTPFVAYNPAPTSSNPLTPAPGVWSLDEALQYTQQGVWPSYPENAIEDVFSTYLYTGNGSTQTINNGINLAGRGGLVWSKLRQSSASHYLVDTVRGRSSGISSNSTSGQTISSAGSDLASFTTTGYTLGPVEQWSSSNSNTNAIVSWTFREQAKFFDVVTYTGNNASNRAISHNLGSTPGFILVKATSTTGDWYALHRVGNSGSWGVGTLNSTGTFSAPSPSFWGNGTTFTAPTSTTFTVSADGGSLTNGSGITFVAYLFAHDAGGFGASGSDNVISCGSYTGDAANPGPTITLGYEPQWVLIKNATTAGWDWYIGDNMRGIPFQSNAVGTPIQTLRPNLVDAEAGQLGMNLLPTGFQPTSVSAGINGSGNTYIYIAIRRGPMRPPLSGTSVFRPTLVAQTDIQQTSNGTFPPDFVFMSSTNGTSRTAYVNQIADRLRGLGVPSDAFSTSTDGLTLTTSDSTSDDASNSYVQLKANGIDITRGMGWNSTNFGNFIYYLMRRSPGFLDVVCYLGNGTARAINHNLTIAPEMMIVKRRNAAGDWQVYSSALFNTEYLVFNTTAARATGATRWNSTTPTSSAFTVGTDATVNASGGTYVAYLFATVGGISKVGSYVGTGTTQQINCGFANGSRFVMIKRTDAIGDWYFWDSARGIVAGNDPYLLFNSTAVEVTNTDFVDTYSLGFELSSTAPAALNASGGTYLFYAIA